MILDVDPPTAIALLCVYVPAFVLAVRATRERLPLMEDFYPQRSPVAQRLLTNRQEEQGAAAREDAVRKRIGLDQVKTDPLPAIEMDWFHADRPRLEVH